MYHSAFVEVAQSPSEGCTKLDKKGNSVAIAIPLSSLYEHEGGTFTYWMLHSLCGSFISMAIIFHS